LPGPAGGQSPASHPWHGADGAWQGSHSAPRTSLPPLGAGGPGDPLTQPAAGTGPTLLPAAGRGLGVPVPTATASTPGVTLSSPGEALNPTMGVLGSPSTEGAPEHSHVPLDQTWHPAASLPPSVTLGSTTVAQSRELHTSPGSPRASPASSSAAPTSVTPQLSPGSRELPGLRSTAGTSPAGPSLAHQLPHTGSGGDPAKSPHVLEESSLGMGEVGPWAVTAPLSWQPGSLAPSSAPGHPQHPAPSQPASSLGSTTAISITTTATTASPALPEAVGMVTAEPPPQGDVTGVTGRPPTHLPTMVLGPPQEPTDTLGPLGHGRGPGSPPAAGDPGLVQPSSSPGGWLGAAPAAGRAPAVFIVEDQAPLWRASLLRIPCQLVLDMSFTPALQDPESHEHQELLHSFNRTVTPLFVSVPGFLRLEVTGIRCGSVVLQYDALFMAERVQVPGLSSLLDAVLGSSSTQPGLVVGTAPVLSNVALEWPLDPCAVLFSCRPGFTCVAGADGNATCSSLCHHDYCKNHGICTHPPERGPLCRCPVGRDFWFVGLRCDYRVTQQSLLGMALGILLSIVLLAAVVTAIAVHRFKVLLLEARADQTRSSYRRFCRLDDISGQYWSRSWLPSASSLDNPAFSNSEELLQLQILDNGCCSCREDSAKQQQAALPARPHCQPSFHYDWDASSSSINDPMVDSGKASDISVSSWPMEPLQWTPFPLLQQLSRQRPHKGRRPHSYCEGMELGTLERSWTA
ncbi:IMPG2 protein, partial [Bucco capensis]|nr:IMPG2 protein [Bucco capensis]